MTAIYPLLLIISRRVKISGGGVKTGSSSGGVKINGVVEELKLVVVVVVLMFQLNLFLKLI